jgi:hypothetical protein
VGVNPEAPLVVERIPRTVVGAAAVVTLADPEVPVPVAKVPTVSMGVAVSTPEKAESTAVAVAAVVPKLPAESTLTVSAPAATSIA